MSTVVELVAWAVVLGIGGAAAMDLWAGIARRVLHVQGLDYALLGRWIGHVAHGRFAHERIGAAAPVRGERALGWVAHYAIAVTFAGLLLIIWGPAWTSSPTIAPPFLIAFGTILAPWFVIQPAMGAGIAGSRTPDPRAT